MEYSTELEQEAAVARIMAMSRSDIEKTLRDIREVVNSDKHVSIEYLDAFYDVIEENFIIHGIFTRAGVPFHAYGWAKTIRYYGAGSNNEITDSFWSSFHKRACNAKCAITRNLSGINRKLSEKIATAAEIVGGRRVNNLRPYHLAYEEEDVPVPEPMPVDEWEGENLRAAVVPGLVAEQEQPQVGLRDVNGDLVHRPYGNQPNQVLMVAVDDRAGIGIAGPGEVAPGWPPHVDQDRINRANRILMDRFNEQVEAAGEANRYHR